MKHPILLTETVSDFFTIHLIDECMLILVISKCGKLNDSFYQSGVTYRKQKYYEKPPVTVASGSTLGRYNYWGKQQLRFEPRLVIWVS